MLTPQGDIRLIDFNISLALGEETIIGRSEGYARRSTMVWIFPTMKRIREKEALRLPVLTEIGVLRRFEE